MLLTIATQRQKERQPLLVTIATQRQKERQKERHKGEAQGTNKKTHRQKGEAKGTIKNNEKAQREATGEAKGPVVFILNLKLKIRTHLFSEPHP